MDEVATPPHIQDLINARLSRRGLVVSLASLPLLSLASACAAHKSPPRGTANVPVSFSPVARTNADTVTVPAGYQVRTVIAWGDPLFEGMAPADLAGLTRAEQEKRFGQNNDMLALFALPFAFPASHRGDDLLLCANHEYADATMMFPQLTKPDAISAAQNQALYASMGISVLALARDGAGWRMVRDAHPGAGKNRRITPFTPVVFAGPAARHEWVLAAGAAFRAAEPEANEGLIPCGTMANCAGGQTPWGTFLSAEENFNFYFHASGDAPEAARKDPALSADAKSFGYPLQRPQPRPTAPAQYDLASNPHGPALYGWTVEIDPYDPDWAPRKRTALGRRKAECANTALTRDGHLAVYSGDDQADEFVYKFVSSKKFDPKNRLANRDLLDEGQLYVARFGPEGEGEWLALTLASANAAAAMARYPAPFRDDGDLLVRAREAARLMGATPMDRPEDVEAILDGDWVGQGPVLINCTNNRVRAQASPASPRRADPADPGKTQANLTGHVLRLDEAGGDCGAKRFTWDVFLLAGDPDTPTITIRDGKLGAVSAMGSFSGDRFAAPDNLCFDRSGNVWIATDNSDAVFADCNDSVLVTSVQATGPRSVKRFLVGPVGAEICGPTFAPDERAFFVAIQHPGEGDVGGREFRDARWVGAAPFSHFPDGGDAWPRSAVMCITKADGGRIGS